MEPIQNINLQSPPAPTHGKNLLVIAIIVVILLVVAGVAYWMLSAPSATIQQQQQVREIVPTPTPTTELDNDTTASIERDLDATTNLGDLDAEFSDLDRDLQGL